MNLYKIGLTALEERTALEEHGHTCRGCGFAWYHAEDNLGNADSHTCSNCGQVQWVVDPNIGAATKPAPAGMKYMTLAGMAFILGAMAYIIKPRPTRIHLLGKGK